MKHPELAVVRFNGEDVIATSGKVSLSSIFNSDPLEAVHFYVTGGVDEDGNPLTVFDESGSVIAEIDRDTYKGAFTDTDNPGYANGIIGEIVDSLVTKDNGSISLDAAKNIYNQIKNGNAKFSTMELRKSGIDYEGGNGYLWLDKNGNDEYDGADEDLTVADLFRSTTGGEGAAKATADLYAKNLSKAETNYNLMKDSTEPDEIEMYGSMVQKYGNIAVTDANRASYEELATVAAKIGEDIGSASEATLTLNNIGYDFELSKLVLTYASNVTAGEGDLLMDKNGSAIGTVSSNTATIYMDPTFYVDPDMINTQTVQSNQISSLRSIFDSTVWGLRMTSDGNTFYFEKDARYSVGTGSISQK